MEARSLDALLGGPAWFPIGDGSHAKMRDMNQHVIHHEGAMEPICVSKLGPVARWRPQDVSNVNYVFMLKSVENFDFSERSLAVCLVLKGRDFLDGNLSVT